MGKKTIRGRTSLGRVAGQFLACLVLAALVAGPASAGGSPLDSAKARLAALEGRIASLQAGLEGLGTRMRTAARSLDAEERAFDSIQQRLMSLRADLAAVRARFDSRQRSLDRLARQAYMDGPGAGLDLVLGATSLADLAERSTLVSRVADAGARMGLSLQRARNRLRRQAGVLAAQLAREAGLVNRRARDRKTLAAAFADQQQQLAALSHARQELAGLVARLRSKLSSQEAAVARRAAGAGMPLTYGQWAQAFLPAMQAPACHANLEAVVAWQSAEGTQTSWNPLATTYSMPGATDFNPTGVKSYPSLADGIRATVETLALPGHGYEAIVASLVACSPPLATAEAVNASDWCRGCRRELRGRPRAGGRAILRHLRRALSLGPAGITFRSGGRVMRQA